MEDIKNAQGGLVDPIDPRDIPFEAFVGADEDFPKTWDWRNQYPIKRKDQGATWSCTGFMTSAYAELLEYADNGKYVELSPRWIYAWVSLGQYKGAYTRDALLRLVSAGIAPEALFPSTPATEAFLTSKEGSSPAVEAEALKYRAKLITSVLDSRNFELLKLAVYKGKGISLGIYNHVMYCPAYDETALICHNSLGGVDTRITKEDVESGKLHSLWTVIDVTDDDMEQIRKWIEGMYDEFGWDKATAWTSARQQAVQADPIKEGRDFARAVRNANLDEAGQILSASKK